MRDGSPPLAIPDDLWDREAVQRALAELDVGALIKHFRRYTGASQSVVGARVGLAQSDISTIERGLRLVQNIGVLHRIAVGLAIPPDRLGLAPRHEWTNPHADGPRRRTVSTKVGPQPNGEQEEDDPVRRRNLLTGMAGLTTAAVLGAPDSASARPSLAGLEDLLIHRTGSPATDPSPAAVQATLNSSAREFTACRYDQLARALPSRIALAQALGADGHLRQAAPAVAELYNTATRLCIKLGEDGLAAVTADRALTAALGTDDALVTAEAHRMVSSAWRRQGHYARATDIAVHAAQQLATDRTTPTEQRLSTQGNLYATAAYTAAKRGDRHTAYTLIREAEATAGRLGHDSVLRGSVFGPSQVRLYQISVCHLLGDAGHAIDHARRIATAELPTTERRARYWIDVARAFHQWNKPDRCYHALLAAEQAAPEEVRRTSVTAMAHDLLRHDRALPGVRAFTQRITPARP